MKILEQRVVNSENHIVNCMRKSMGNKSVKISIVMATHNGTAYLEEQFQSLFAQTLQPDEVVVYDDASTDGTVTLLEEIRSQAPFPVCILNGQENLRVNAAFSSALAACKGEFIFFCDQDDV